MADPTEPESTTGTPRWVKVFGIIALVVILLLVVLLFTGRHTPSGGAGQLPPYSFTEHGMQQP